MKLALCLIVEGKAEEAECLARCLTNVMPHVDKAFITITHRKGKKRNKDVEEVCNRWNKEGGGFMELDGVVIYDNPEDRVIISDFEWCFDFSAARNFNFSQVPEEYTHILWCDADDQFRGLERLKPLLKAKEYADGFGMWYLFHFDKYKQADVVHKKTMVVKNPKGNNWVEWKGKLHEDLISNIKPEIYMVDKYFNGGIDRMHFPTDDQTFDSMERNVEIAQEALKKDKKEPRNYWNVGQSLFMAGKYKESSKALLEFLKLSASDEEKYIAHLRLSDCFFNMKDRETTLEHSYYALGLRPEYPDAYISTANYLYSWNRLDEAEKYYLLGLKIRPKYNDIMVYNPRDYDYNPMRRLISLYTDKGRPDLGIPLMEACMKIYPDNKELKVELEELKGQKSRLEKILTKIEKMKQLSDEDFKKEVDEMPPDERSHPLVCSIYNQKFIKTETSGKEIVIYCYPTAFDFNPELFEKVGFGGSEEAVINLSKGLADLGWDVTVYNRCGHVPRKFGKVWFKPFWMWNTRDVVDNLIIWRSPQILNYELGAKKIYLDLHDVVPQEELSPERLKKLTKIFVKTKAHRVLFPKVPDDMFAIIPNGQDLSLFQQEETKNQYMILNTSSPDRSMDVLPELFKEVKKQVPEARLKWCYGWKNFDDWYYNDPLRQAWKKRIVDSMIDAGIEDLGRVTQKEVAKLYLEANILAYPSEFYEIDCISVKKAQYAGAIPVTTDFAAFEESVQYGVKIPSKKTIKNWSEPYQMGYGITDPKMKKEWVDAVVKILKTPLKDRSAMMKWASQFEWPRICSKWSDVLKANN